jgi:hypothetical protein
VVVEKVDTISASNIGAGNDNFMHYKAVRRREQTRRESMAAESAAKAT